VIRRPWVRPLLVAGLAAVAAVGCILLPGGPWARMPFAFALAFALPGYALVGALLPHLRRDGLRVQFLSLALSLALAVIVAVELGAPGHLNTESWAGVLAGVTACAAVIMGLRAGSSHGAAPRRSTRGGRRLIVPCVLAVCAAAILGGAIALARTPLQVPDDRGYTVLTIAPAPGDPGRVVVAAQSEEASARRFRLVIDAPGAPRASSDLRLVPGQRAQREIRVPPGTVGVVRARLLDLSDSPASVYRRVRLALPAPGPAPVVQEFAGQ
jgi:hypothetical protein